MGNTICKSKSTLEQYNIHNTNEFTLNNIFTEARVIDIYDGDTCTCIIPLFNNYYQFKIRLADIDTCEKKSKNAENKLYALNAKKRLCHLVSNDFCDIDINISKNDLITKLNDKCYIIKIKCSIFDKYGRLLAWLFPNNSNKNESIENSFNYILIREKLAYKYDGGTKLTEEEQIKLLKA